MQTFSTLLSATREGNAAGQARSSTRAASNESEAGGFDRMLQSHARGTEARTASVAPAKDGPRADAPERAREAEGQRARDAEPAQEAADAKPRETRDHDTRRADAKDADTRTSADSTRAEGEPDSAEAGEAAAVATPTDAATAATPQPADAAAPSLPEQLLALLNGLAAPTAAGTAPLDATADTVSTDAPLNATATKSVLPLPLQAATTAQTAPAAQTDASAFAVAMGAAMDAGAEAGDDAPDLSAAIASVGDVEPSALPTATTPVGVARTATPTATAPTQSPVALDADFDDGVGSRIAWMADQKVGHAEIRVSPDHLGTIDVRLQIDGNRVNAEFHSAHADVRHALESSLPRLRDMLGQQGLQLGQADVGQRQPGQQPSSNGQAGPANGSDRADGASNTANAGWTPGPAVRATRGLLDEYA